MFKIKGLKIIYFRQVYIVFVIIIIATNKMFVVVVCCLTAVVRLLLLFTKQQNKVEGLIASLNHVDFLPLFDQSVDPIIKLGTEVNSSGYIVTFLSFFFYFFLSRLQLIICQTNVCCQHLWVKKYFLLKYIVFLNVIYFIFIFIITCIIFLMFSKYNFVFLSFKGKLFFLFFFNSFSNIYYCTPKYF